MDNITVLLTGAGAPGAPSIIQSLRLIKERKIKIVGVDMNRDSVGFSMVDKNYIVPSADSDEFIDSIIKVCDKESVNVIIPLVTKELHKFAKFKDRFLAMGIKVVVSNEEALKTANNKYLLMKKAEKIGVPVPKFRLVNTYELFREAVFELGYPKIPVCFKPPISNGLRGFRILRNDVDRLDVLLNQKPTNVITTFEEISPVLKKTDKFPELLVMEYLPGEEYSVDSIADEGKPIIAVPRLREKIKMGISFVGKVVYDKEIIDYSLLLLKGIGLHGNIGFQFKRDIQGVPKLIESNPRVQGTMILCTAAGVNMVYFGVKTALREKFEIPKVEWGTRMIRYWREEFYDPSGSPFAL